MIFLGRARLRNLSPVNHYTYEAIIQKVKKEAIYSAWMDQLERQKSYKRNIFNLHLIFLLYKSKFVYVFTNSKTKCKRERAVNLSVR